MTKIKATQKDGGRRRRLRVCKRFSDKGGDVDFKTKSGTAGSHSYLNQKPWHPLSYPNQRRKWIAEQTHVQRERRAEEVAHEFAHEQEFFCQAARLQKRERKDENDEGCELYVCPAAGL
ncbi:unnamed protein product [Camellia sinensis]